jgi:hypothetical protein
MRLTTNHKPSQAKFLRCILQSFFICALILMACLGFSQVGSAAEIEIVGSGTYKPPTVEKITALAPDIPFSVADLASGTWSFLVRYEERTPDADPDPYLGRYVGAIRMFRLTLGTTTVEFPADQAQLVVSDGALGVPNRESILLEASFATSSGVMRVSWSQLNQQPNGPDLRGVPGSLESDALPAPSMIAKLATSSPFDRFLLLRLDRAGGGQPLLYISSSNVSVLARPAPTK